MTDDMMHLRAIVERNPTPIFCPRCLAKRRIERVGAATCAGYSEKSAERLAQRYRNRDWQTGFGTVELRVNPAAQGAAVPRLPGGAAAGCS